MKALLGTCLWLLLLFFLVGSMFFSVNGDEKALSRDNVTSIGSSKGVTEARNKTTNNVVINNKGSGGYGWGFGWGWGGGGGGGGRGGGGGGGGGWWRWGCRKHTRKRVRSHHSHRNYIRHGEHRDFNPVGENYYVIGEFAECMGGGRCRGMRLDCPLHCGGPCFYDCTYMCKPHCRR